MPITTTAAIIGHRLHRPPVGAETPEGSRGDCCSLGVGRGGVAAVACIRRAALWAAATEEAATAASPQGASILPPQLKQFAEASGFFVPQRVQYISIPKGSENTKLLIYDGPANHISVHKRSTAETDIHWLAPEITIDSLTRCLLLSSSPMSLRLDMCLPSEIT